MKCDELEKFDATSNAERSAGIESRYAYDADEVDEAIAELQAANEKLSNALDKERSETIKYMDELCNAKNEIERLTIDKRNVELRADTADSTIEKLKKRMDEYHLMSDIRRAKNKELKRALWLARALALSRFDVDEYLRKSTHCNSRFWNNGFNTFNEACKQMQKAINIAEAKCRAKAKEYK